jgi:hypothetical protein
MLHALQHHWRAYKTDDEAILMIIGPSRTGAPLEVGVLFNPDGIAVIHAMAARPKFLEGWPT